MSAVAIATLVIAAASMAAQSKPNFAGKWTFVPDSTGAIAPIGRGVGLGQEFTAVHDDKTLTVAMKDPQLGELKSVYNLDGSETRNPINFGGQTVDRASKVKWDGAKLVITTTISMGANVAEATQSWALDGSGNLLVETVSSFAAQSMTTKATYKKN